MGVLLRNEWQSWLGWVTMSGRERERVCEQERSDVGMDGWEELRVKKDALSIT
jgi:hypothetical protein